jgi:hypothetical protein
VTFVLPSVIPEGARNDTLTRYAGKLRRGGASEDQILAELCETNRVRCRPPLGDREIATIARSMVRYAPTEDGSYVPFSIYIPEVQRSLAKRGLKLLRSGAVRRRSLETYEVRGRSGGLYHVVVRERGPVCSCGKYRTPEGQRCAHVWAVRLGVRGTLSPLEVGGPLP